MCELNFKPFACVILRHSKDKRFKIDAVQHVFMVREPHHDTSKNMFYCLLQFIRIRD